jgi:gamma-glutamylcyclotransferase (GGCT)/AIG2-like uncharacterized protein YtfP
MFLNGTAMSGGADHHLVGDSPLVADTSTASKYRFWSAADQFPALEFVGDGGRAIRGEVYDMSYKQLRDALLPGEPAGLELGIIELKDGSSSFAMVLRRSFPPHEQLIDISAVGSWRAYRANGS